MRVAVIQYELKPGDVEANHTKAVKLLEDAAHKGAEMAVLPELWNTGYALDRLAELAQNSQGASVKLLRQTAEKHRMFIFGGSIPEKRDGHYYNTAFAIDQNGQVIGKYRKTHLYPFGLCEDEYFTPGDEWGLAETPWAKVGMMICYDIRFPELARNLTIRGARILTVSAEFPKPG